MWVKEVPQKYKKSVGNSKNEMGTIKTFRGKCSVGRQERKQYPQNSVQVQLLYGDGKEYMFPFILGFLILFLWQTSKKISDNCKSHT